MEGIENRNNRGRKSFDKVARQKQGKEEIVA